MLPGSRLQRNLRYKIQNANLLIFDSRFTPNVINDAASVVAEKERIGR